MLRRRAVPLVLGLLAASLTSVAAAPVASADPCTHQNRKGAIATHLDRGLHNYDVHVWMSAEWNICDPGATPTHYSLHITKGAFYDDAPNGDEMGGVRKITYACYLADDKEGRFSTMTGYLNADYPNNDIPVSYSGKIPYTQHPRNYCILKMDVANEPDIDADMTVMALN